MLMSDKTMILTIFKDEESADTAAVGVLVLDKKGELKVSKRSWDKGAGSARRQRSSFPLGWLQA
jgi:hypothetical protein